MAMTTSTTNDQKILVGHNHPVNHVISSIESSPPPPPAAGIKSSKIWFWPRLLLPQRFFPALAFGSISLIFIFLSMSLPSPLTIYIPPLSFLSNFIHSHGDYTSQVQNPYKKDFSHFLSHSFLVLLVQKEISGRFVGFFILWILFLRVQKSI